MIDTPKCYSCKYYKSSILYKNSCDKYEEISKEITNETKECKYYKNDN